MPDAPTGRRAIVVLDYDAAWPALFAETHCRLNALLAELVLEICHVGSTAVPGLCAKPKIDVDVVLTSASAIPERDRAPEGRGLCLPRRQVQ